MAESVVMWLDAVGLSSHASTLCDNGYDDLAVCEELTDGDLTDIGIDDGVVRGRIIAAAAQLKSEGLDALLAKASAASAASAAVKAPPPVAPKTVVAPAPAVPAIPAEATTTSAAAPDAAFGDVGRWLHSEGLGMHAAVLCENGYDDLSVCAEVSEGDLEDIGIDEGAVKSAILDAITKLKARGVDETVASLAAESKKAASIVAHAAPATAPPTVTKPTVGSKPPVVAKPPVATKTAASGTPSTEKPVTATDRPVTATVTAIDKPVTATVTAIDKPVTATVT
eukprot:Opistho-2@61300